MVTTVVEHTDTGSVDDQSSAKLHEGMTAGTGAGTAELDGTETDDVGASDPSAGTRGEDEKIGSQKNKRGSTKNHNEQYVALGGLEF